MKLKITSLIQQRADLKEFVEVFPNGDVGMYINTAISSPYSDNEFGTSQNDLFYEVLSVLEDISSALDGDQVINVGVMSFKEKQKIVMDPRVHIPA